jgi:hypothetical protein
MKYSGKHLKRLWETIYNGEYRYAIVTVILCLFFFSCRNKKTALPAQDSLSIETANNKNKNSLSDSTRIDTIPDFDRKQLKDHLPVVTIKVPISPINVVTNPISCFDPNLKINEALELINTGAKDTQWFIVEQKEVDYLKKQFDQLDTILVKNELQKLGWKLVDSTYTSKGNQNKISVRMQKEDRVCNITKTLFLSENKKNNQIQEWFEIREIKK